MYEIEALIEVLTRKGIVSKEEVLEEIKKMRTNVKKESDYRNSLVPSSEIGKIQ